MQSKVLQRPQPPSRHLKTTRKSLPHQGSVSYQGVPRPGVSPPRVIPRRPSMRRGSARAIAPSRRMSSHASRWLVLAEAMLWIVGAVAVRLAINGLMAASSQFWLLGATVACLPAVTAIWMTHLSPQRGFVLGYRCFLVMTGLLLGGKLGGVS